MAISEPNWLAAYTKAAQGRRLLASQTAAIQHVCGQRLQQTGHTSPPALAAWLSGNEDLLGLMAALVAAIDNRQPGEAAERIRTLPAVLGRLAGEAPAALDQVAALTGDLSADLAEALGQIGPERG